MTSGAAAPGARATPVDVPDGGPIAVARPRRRVAPARETKAERYPVTAEQVGLLSEIRRHTDRVTALEHELAVARDYQERAIVAALREGVTRHRIGEYACAPGEPPLSRWQINRLAEKQYPSPTEGT